MQLRSFFQQYTPCAVFLYNSLKISVSVMFLFSGSSLFAQESDFEKKVTVDELPIPNEKKQLFYLQRDPDANTVVYQLNLDGEEIDADKPVNVYWIRYTEGGERKGLNLVQRTMAYGVSHKALDNGDFELRIAAYKTLPLRLSYCKKHKRYMVFASINNREAILDRIFVRIDGGSVFSPDIAYFELRGRDVSTYAKVTQRVKP